MSKKHKYSRHQKESHTLTMINLKKPCEMCYHRRAWDKPRGIFCSKCGFKIE